MSDLVGSFDKASRNESREAFCVPERLKQRADFLQAARGTRVHLSLFSLQAAKRPVPAPSSDGRVAADQVAADHQVGPFKPRIGLTVTKKTGGAVERNRIRRRLKEALRHAKALSTEPDTDYVIVARREALTVPFARLIADLETAVRKAGAQLKRPRGSTRQPDERPRKG
ncbi:ribonuclease P protein component [Lichenihabitans psoromatis]|uniref:ribonuclease P protein component n=1 Tax=Lichenihabitans psoromatis TaxID=2528642 RepID=UPI0010356358|nr:ribonuclease P protein component [Lichenihabitans psoromatis]